MSRKRIRIDEMWWSNPRRSKLIEMFNGDSRQADGLMLQAWRLAQTRASEESLPLSEFLWLSKSELLFECDLAVLSYANSEADRSLVAQIIDRSKKDHQTMNSCRVKVRELFYGTY